MANPRLNKPRAPATLERSRASATPINTTPWGLQMAATLNDNNDDAASAGSDAEYGHSQHDDALLASVLDDIELRHRASFPHVLPTIESEDPSFRRQKHVSFALAAVDADLSLAQGALDAEAIPWTTSAEAIDLGLSPRRAGSPTAAHAQLGYDRDFPERSVSLSAEPTNDQRAESREATTDDATGDAHPEYWDEHDKRSPLERFRSPPKKSLSVSDLVAPAWCELQFWYTLVKFGRKRPTPAMKRGSSVHKVLEEEVKVTVPVDARTREDSWGLQFWNVVQGLRALRVTGMTREIDVWGTVDGLVVGGVIDELSTTCPDPDLERDTGTQRGNKNAGRRKAGEAPPDQAAISEFFRRDAEPRSDSGAHKDDSTRVYIIDVKTRNSASLPRHASLRPTRMQLMLYRKLLVNLARNDVDASAVFSRYRLDPAKPFSESLIAQLADMGDNFHEDATAESVAPMESGLHTVAELLAHNSVEKMWRLMMEEFRKTLPKGEESIGKVLKAEYRRGEDGQIMGSRTFAYDEDELVKYVGEEMEWWRGKREAKGVDVEEAFKCRSCDFADSCGWRANKIDEAIMKHRIRVEGRRRSEV